MKNYNLENFKRNNYDIVNLYSQLNLNQKNKLKFNKLVKSQSNLDLDRYIITKFKYRFRAYSKFIYNYKTKKLILKNSYDFTQSKKNNLLFGNVKRNTIGYRDMFLINFKINK